MKRFALLLVFGIIASGLAKAQVEERQRPAEWEKLVMGGRYMDRFEAMAPSRTARANWGAEAVRKRYVDGMAIEVRTEPITAKTKKIELRIRGEKDFDPAKEVDVKSLILGSYKEVNYGRGAKPVKVKQEGGDLIVTFSGKGSGIDANEWAPKLIGRSKTGKLLWGYARLQYVNYNPAILSPSAAYEKDGLQWVVVENFGLTESEPQTITIKNVKNKEVSVSVPALKPYEKKVLKL